MARDGWRAWFPVRLAFARNAGRKSARHTRKVRPHLETLEIRTTPTTINLTSSADNTLYQVSSSDPKVQLSNGAGTFLFVGDTKQTSNAIRRGAIKFDLSGIPTGSTITSATLTLDMTLAVSTVSQNIALHRALLNWGEGTSVSMGGGGAGALASDGDVTWFYTFYQTQLWNTPGGDFVSAASATTAVGITPGTYQWTSPGLIADLQQWVNNPSQNFGWIMTGNETASGTAMQFGTKENTGSAAQPQLTVTYTAPSQLAVTGPPAATAGTPFNLTVTAQDSGGNTVSNFNGTVTLSSSSGADIAPTSVTLKGGTATIPVTLTAAGPQTITAAFPGLTSGMAPVTVSAGPFTQYLVAVQGPSTIQAGIAALTTVQGADQFGNPVFNYSGPASVTATIAPTSTASNFPTTVSINNTGLGFFLATFQQTGTYTVSVANGSFTGSAGPVSVQPGPAVRLGFGIQPVNTPTGVTLPVVSVQVFDAFGNVVTGDNTDTVTVGIASGPGSYSPGSTTTATVHNGVATFNNLVLIRPGVYALSELDPGLYTGPASIPFTVIPLQVVPGSFVGSPSGFSLQFNAPILVNSTTPVLYGQGFGATAPAPSVTVTGPSGPVPGSLVVSAANNTITFVQTNTTSFVNNGTPVLPDGVYTVDLSSSAARNGLQAQGSGGGFLDGKGTDTPGSGDFTATFTVTSAAAHDDVIWVPPAADGPLQPLNAPGTNQIGGGYPIYIDDSMGNVTSVQLTLNYNPAMLTITAATGNSALPGSTFTLLASSTPGQAVLQYTGTLTNVAHLLGGQVPLGFLTATVPNSSAATPIYHGKNLLHLSGISVNGGGLPAVGSDAVHVVAYVGDADGNGAYSSSDAVLITRVAVSTDTGFTAYPLVDPTIVADTDGSGFIPSDAALQANEAGVGFPTANLASPPIPAGANVTPVANNVDPALSLPRNLQVSANGTGTVPVNIDDAHPAGSTGLIDAHLALTYDPHQFAVSAADIQLGSVLTGGDWSIAPIVDQSTGQIAITLSSNTPIAQTLGGSLVTIEFHQNPIASGPATTKLVASVDPDGNLFSTELADAQGTFTLTPSPTDDASDPLQTSVMLVAAVAPSTPGETHF
jgi:hypothetical protein